MSPIKAVIFDWAGTMIDFGSRAPVMAMAQVFEQEGVPADIPLIRRYMGMAKRDHVEAMLAETAFAEQWQAAKGAPSTNGDVDRIMAALEPAMRESAAQCAQLIPGAADTAAQLIARGIRIGSTTGYTREMMAAIIPAAAEQGYAPEAIICAGETREGRPAPLMIWRVLEELSIWPAGLCVKVDDAPVGIEAGRNAGAWTVGLIASGNALGMTYAEYSALSDDEKRTATAPAIADFTASRADFLIATVADLPAAIALIEARIEAGHTPGQHPTQTIT